MQLDEARHQHQHQAEKQAVEENGKKDIVFGLRGTWTQALAHIILFSPFFQTSLVSLPPSNITVFLSDHVFCVCYHFPHSFAFHHMCICLQVNFLLEIQSLFP